MMQRVLRLYEGESLGTRLFVRARHLLAPLESIAAYLPWQGRILDVGCGHGLFGNLLAVQSPRRQVLGVDPSAVKVRVAQRSAAGLPNVVYRVGRVQDVAESGFDAVTILDVLYLLPYPEKLRLLECCRERMAPNGLLLLKTNDTRPSWKYGITRLQELLMTRLGLTMGSGLYFLSAEENRALLEAAGFQAETVYLRHWSPYPHVLFVARLGPRV